jgi:thioredoxin
MSDEEEIKKIRDQKEDMLKKMIAGPPMPQNVVHIDSVDQFNEIIEKYKDQIIVIDFWAEWCGPCKMFGPIFEQVQKSDWGKQYIFAKLDTERLPGVSQQLQVMGIPMVMFIKGKKELFRQAGAMQRAQFEMLLSRVKEAVDKMESGSPMHS